MDIFLFTTNIEKSDLTRLSALLESIAGIEKWTIDLDDCDHVLRIVCDGVCFDMLQSKLTEVGFDCQYML